MTATEHTAPPADTPVQAQIAHSPGPSYQDLLDADEEEAERTRWALLMWRCNSDPLMAVPLRARADGVLDGIHDTLHPPG